ncbi:unnamed protein product, partial [Sphagnum tenellum]
MVSPARVAAASSRPLRSSVAVSVQEEAQAIEKEEMLMERPASLLREGEDLQWDNPSTSSMRARFETMIRKAQ